MVRVTVMVMVRDGPCHRALDKNFSPYASLFLRDSKLSTIEQLGQMRARTLVRVRVRVMVSDGPCPRALYKNFILHHYCYVSLRSRTSIIWVRWRLSCLNARSFDRPPARPPVRSFACLPSAERLDFPSFPSEFIVSRSILLWNLPLQLEYEKPKCVGLLTFRNLSYLGIKLSELTSCALKYARSSIGIRLLVVSSRLSPSSIAHIWNCYP